jgi:hypothetical protein
MHAPWRNVLLLPILLASGGCNSTESLHWSEEVRLPDRTVIVVERWGQRNHVTFLGTAMTAGVSDQVLELPGSIRWEQNHSGIPGKYSDGSGEQAVTPFALNRVDGRWILATSANDGDCVNFFAWDGKAWTPVPRTDQLLDGTDYNLLPLHSTMDRLPIGSVSLEDKGALTGEDFEAPPRSIRQFLVDDVPTCSVVFGKRDVMPVTPASANQAAADAPAADTPPE